jgi:ADP-glucose pyrophosphorylase
MKQVMVVEEVVMKRAVVVKEVVVKHQRRMKAKPSQKNQQIHERSGR